MAFIIYLILILIYCSVIRTQHEHNNREIHGFDDFIVHDRDHLREDVRDYYHVNLDDKTSDGELDFYFFQMHDYDGSASLDGIEILAALNHLMGTDALAAKGETTTEPPEHKEDDDTPTDPYEVIAKIRRQRLWNDKFEDDSKIIDDLLKKYDTDNDGFISFPEYIVARSRLDYDRINKT